MMSACRVLILIAPSFQEEVFSITIQIRQAGVKVSLVGLTAGLIHSLHGIAIQPDYTLSEIDSAENCTLIITGDAQCTTALLSDPRVHQLIHRVHEQNNLITSLRPAQNLVCQSFQILCGGSILCQNEMETSCFIQLLLERIQKPFVNTPLAQSSSNNTKHTELKGTNKPNQEQKEKENP